MKKILILIVILAGAIQLNAQKIGYINTETILSQIPEYKTAQDKLNSLNEQYKSKIESEYKVIEQLYNNYQSKKSSLSNQQRTQKENEIINKEKTVKELQKTYFGENGYMQKKSEELLNPIKERVDSAVKKIAQTGGYMLIIDLSIMQGVIYDDPKYDLSQKVIDMIK
jgi:Outer membrane protein